MGLHELLSRLGGERRIDYSLERFQSALEWAGHPEKSVQTLSISGTNGKGATTLLISSALREAGFKVCTYLSPHLQHVGERSLYQLESATEAELDELAIELSPAAAKFDLTYFEFLTLIHFARAKALGADFNVLETGLGGRLDATNVTNPIACAIPSVSFDHQSYLGDTLEQILDEKLGIVPKEGLLFTGIRDEKLLAQIEKRCEALDAIYYYSKEIVREVESRSWDGQIAKLNGHTFTLTNPTPGYLDNAATAFLLLQIVFPRIPIETLVKAFGRVKHPGRLETVAEFPRVVLSGDHNPAGVADLAAFLDRSAGEKKPGKLFTVAAFSPDKPYRELFEKLRALSTDIVLTGIERHRGAMPADYESTGPYVADAGAAVDRMLAQAGPDDVVLVTGSLYLVGELRGRWRSKVSYLD